MHYRATFTEVVTYQVDFETYDELDIPKALAEEDDDEWFGAMESDADDWPKNENVIDSGGRTLVSLVQLD